MAQSLEFKGLGEVTLSFRLSSVLDFLCSTALKCHWGWAYVKTKDYSAQLGTLCRGHRPGFWSGNAV